MRQDYFVLFACCIPVKGHSRSTICDLQRNSFELIPNILFEILTEHEGKAMDTIFAAYHHEYNREIEEYLDFLVEKEYGFYSAEPQSFPKLDLTWHNPFPVTHALVDFDEKSKHPLPHIVKQLTAMFCPVIELRFFHAPSLEVLENTLQTFQDSPFRSVQMIAGYSKELTIAQLTTLAYQYPRLQSLVIHSTPSENIPASSDISIPHLTFIEQNLSSEACCGNISPRYFTVNRQFFTEAQTFNSCLNRKISIDKRGFIKNCPSMTQHFGHIETTSLADVVKQQAFQKVWHISKDQVTTCQDCEFRYVCHDCRAYVANPGNALSKPAKCGYNPYEATWEAATIG